MLHEGPITRTVKDAAIMLEVMAGPHWGNRYSLLPFLGQLTASLKKAGKGHAHCLEHRPNYAQVRREVKEICAQAARKFSSLGAKVEEAHPAWRNPEMSYVTVVNAELAAMFTRFGPLSTIKDRLDPRLTARREANQNLTAFDYLQATFDRRELAACGGQFFQKYVLLLTPTFGTPACPINPDGAVQEIDGQPVTSRGWLLPFPFNLFGQPTASVPVGWTHEGLPVGRQIVGW